MATRKKSSAASKLRAGKKSTRKQPAVKRDVLTSELAKLLDNCPEQTFYTELTPMLATLVDKPVTGSDWALEIKWDGYRAVTFHQGNKTALKSRNGNSFDDKFYPVFDALDALGIDAVLDGEIVALKKDGLPDFGTLQNWRSEADGQLIYYVFDLLWYSGRDVRDLTLEQRRRMLEDVLPVTDMIRLSETFAVSASDFLASVREMGMEGIIAKKMGSPYRAGERTRDWLKIKASKRHEVVICGYTNNKGSGKIFSALLVGVYSNGSLVYTGKIGTGFSEKLQREMMASFKAVITDECPFDSEPDYNKPTRFNPRPAKASVTWLKPKLVCEVNYAEITSDGIMRHPSFVAMRDDKKAKDVTAENAMAIEVAPASGAAHLKSKISVPSASERRTLLNPTDESQVRDIDGHALKFTNLSKPYWPKDKITKRDMLNYYYQIAPVILPYLKDRPQSLNRFPNGIDGKSFYQKDVTGKVPEWVSLYQYHSGVEVEVDKHFMVPQDEAAVLLMASLGCIEMNPWSSRIDKPDYPDWCIIDLDPDQNSFDQVITAAQVTHQLLDSIKFPNYVKTSGSTGLHIYIPLGRKYTYEQSKEVARTIVTQVHQEIPKFTSIERKVADRSGKMYLDFLQNRPKATLAAPYSLRPKPGAPVSMPLHWDEVKKGLKMADFNIHNAVARVREVGDIFKPVMGKGVTI